MFELSALNWGLIALAADWAIRLVMLPVVILYLFMQKRFIEGVERSGIVG